MKYGNHRWIFCFVFISSFMAMSACKTGNPIPAQAADWIAADRPSDPLAKLQDDDMWLDPEIDDESDLPDD